MSETAKGIGIEAVKCIAAGGGAGTLSGVIGYAVVSDRPLNCPAPSLGTSIGNWNPSDSVLRQQRCTVDVMGFDLGTPLQAATTIGMIVAVAAAVICAIYLAWVAHSGGTS